MQVFAPVGLLERLARHGVRNLDGEGESLAKPDLRVKKIDRLGRGTLSVHPGDVTLPIGPDAVALPFADL